MKSLSPLIGLLMFASVSTAGSPESKVAWYGQLSDGLSEAKRSGRPILLVSGAPQCLGVSGIW